MIATWADRKRWGMFWVCFLRCWPKSVVHVTWTHRTRPGMFMDVPVMSRRIFRDVGQNPLFMKRGLIEHVRVCLVDVPVMSGDVFSDVGQNPLLMQRGLIEHVRVCLVDVLVVSGDVSTMMARICR